MTRVDNSQFVVSLVNGEYRPINPFGDSSLSFHAAEAVGHIEGMLDSTGGHGLFSPVAAGGHFFAAAACMIAESSDQRPGTKYVHLIECHTEAGAWAAVRALFFAYLKQGGLEVFVGRFYHAQGDSWSRDAIEDVARDCGFLLTLTQPAERASGNAHTTPRSPLLADFVGAGDGRDEKHSPVKRPVTEVRQLVLGALLVFLIGAIAFSGGLTPDERRFGLIVALFSFLSSASGVQIVLSASHSRQK